MSTEVNAMIRAAKKVGRHGLRDERDDFVDVPSRTQNRRISRPQMDASQLIGRVRIGCRFG